MVLAYFGNGFRAWKLRGGNFFQRESDISRSGRTMPLLESVRVTVFEGKIPIFLFPRPLPFEIVLSHDVQVGRVGQLCIGCRLLSRFYPDCVSGTLFGRSPMRRALGVERGHAADKKTPALPSSRRIALVGIAWPWFDDPIRLFLGKHFLACCLPVLSAPLVTRFENWGLNPFLFLQA